MKDNVPTGIGLMGLGRQVVGLDVSQRGVQNRWGPNEKIQQEAAGAQVARTREVRYGRRKQRLGYLFRVWVRAVLGVWAWTVRGEWKRGRLCTGTGVNKNRNRVGMQEEGKARR